MNILEKVSRIICEAAQDKEEHWEDWKPEAKAAIQAMIEPTGFFICGGSKELGRAALPKGLWICPAYGSDVMVEYVQVVKPNNTLKE